MSHSVKVIASGSDILALREKWDSNLTNSMERIHKAKRETQRLSADLYKQAEETTDARAKKGLERAYEKTVREIRKSNEAIASEPMIRKAINATDNDAVTVRFRAVMCNVLDDHRSDQFDAKLIAGTCLRVSYEAEPDMNARQIAEFVVEKLQADKAAEQLAEEEKAKAQEAKAKEIEAQLSEQGS